MSRGRDLDDRETEKTSPQPEHDDESRDRDCAVETIDRIRPGESVTAGNCPENPHELYDRDPGDSRERQERDEIRTRTRSYTLGARDLETMQEIGKFRTVATDDLERFRFEGDAGRMNYELRRLAEQGLVCRYQVASKRGAKIRVIVLTKAGKRLLDSNVRRSGAAGGARQRVYADLKKPAEIFHDAAIYRMYQREAGRIRSAGGTVTRVILDYELKKSIYPALARAKKLSPEEYHQSQVEIARDHGLKVVDGKIPLPDLRIEYETRDQEIDKVDLELATGHYKRGQLAEKARAGFHIYIAGSDSARHSAVRDERELTAGILSL